MEGKVTEVKVRDTIKIVEMKDEPDYAGRIGKVEFIDSLNQIHGTWGGCAIIPEVDSFIIIKEV
jgi:hypothetical protein